MSLRVFAWDSNPTIDSRLYRISNLRGEEKVAMGLADFITLPDGRRAIQLRPTIVERSEKVAGFSNLVPFGRVYNPMLRPPALHYEIPHAGDCRSVSLRRFGLRRVIVDHKQLLLSRTRKVSARKIDFTTIQLSKKKSPTISSSLTAVSQTA